MTEDAPPDVKRRRLSAANGNHQSIRCLPDLPGGILAHAASFLATPSKVLFAIALEFPLFSFKRAGKSISSYSSPSWEENSAVLPNERSSTIVGNQWDVLDFGETEGHLSKKLIDSDLRRVLLCIDAVNNVKRLKLTNCTKITGAGLEPLRGSLIIEQIDLSLAEEHQSPDLDPEPPISCEHVLPILDSIISQEGCHLQHVQFPSVWRTKRPTDTEFHAFIERYNQMRDNGDEISCLECNESLPNNGFEWIDTRTHGRWYGTHCHTCYGCFKHYCYGCEIDGGGREMIYGCNSCKRDYCKVCSEMTECKFCEELNCNDCYEHQCHCCNEKICSPCVRNHQECHECADCKIVICSGCEDVEGGIYVCEECSLCCCSDCRLQRFRQGQHDCTECIKKITPLLVGESVLCKRLREEVESLKVEIEELKSENKELRSRK